MAYTGQKQGAIQTGYFDQPLDGYPGQLASISDPYLIDGYPSEEVLPCGLGVVGGTAIEEVANEFYAIDAPFGIRRPIGTDVAGDFVGILYRGDGVRNDENGVAGYEVGDMASVIRKGRVYVPTPVAVDPGDPVYMYIDDSDEHGLALGSFTNAAAETATDTVLIAGATWWKRSPADTIAVIELGY